MAGRLSYVDAPGCGQLVFGVWFDASAEGGVGSRATYNDNKPRASCIPSQCVWEISAALTYCGQETLRLSDLFSARTMISVKWFEYRLPPS